VVEVVQINHIHLQVAQALFALVANMRRVVRMRRGAAKVPDFRRNDLCARLHTQLLEAAPQNALRTPVAVHVGVIPVVHARIQPHFDGSQNLIFIHLGPANCLTVLGRPVGPAHRPAAKADLRDTNVGVAKSAVAHAAS